MKKFRDSANQTLTHLFVTLGVPAKLVPHVEDIEQVTGKLALVTNPSATDPKSPEGATSLVAKVTLIRSVKDHDWKKFMRALAPKAVAVRHAGKVYYRASAKDTPVAGGILGLFGETFCYHFPDRRTVLLEDEDNLRRLLGRGKGPAPRHVWDKDWKRLERGLAAIAYDTRDWDRLGADVSGKNDKGADSLTVILRESNSLVFGFDHRDGATVFQALTRTKTV